MPRYKWRSSSGASVTVRTINVGAGGTGVKLELPPASPPLSTLPDLGPFVGRTKDHAILDECFTDRRVGRRVVLFGDPGLGKTHLATAWATTHAHRYPGGAYFVPFNLDPAHALARLVEARPQGKAEDL